MVKEFGFLILSDLLSNTHFFSFLTCNIENILQELVSTAEESAEKYDISKDRSRVDAEPEDKKEAREMIMFKGQSKRLWNELYKVNTNVLNLNRH